MEKETGFIPTIPFGEMKMMYRPGHDKDKPEYTNFIMFVRKDGTWKDNFDCGDCDPTDVCIPVVALNFKDKESINALINMLEKFRDYFYGKTAEQIEEAMEDEKPD